MAQDELRTLEARREAVENEVTVLLIPKDPNDEKNVIVEIRAGTGGDEAALFAAELFRMYSRYAESQGWRVEILESSPSTMGGLKEIVAAIQGKKVYSKLKYESGVHRVQRVPATEQQGRIHTSAATVARLPEAEDIDIKIEAKDLRIDTFCSSGPGGPIREHDLLRRSYHAHSQRRPGGFAAGRKIRKSRIARRPCASCGRGFTKWSRRSSMPRLPPNAAGRSRRATVWRRFVPTIFRRTASPTTASGFTLHQLTEAMDGKLGALVDALVTHYESERLNDELGADAA